VVFQTFCCVSVGLFTVGLLIFWFYILLYSQIGLVPTMSRGKRPESDLPGL